jgi:APA family basic amino acid/polyamine antiporter
MDPALAPVATPDPSRLPRHLGTWNAALLLVTFTIGVGILQSPGVVAARTGGIALAYAAWVVGAVAAVSGALVMAELAVRTPRSGGTTVFLREAFGARAAFMFGWTSMLLNPVAAAAITLVSVRNLGSILGLGEGVQTGLGLGWVGGIMLLNMWSSRTVGRIIGGVGLCKISALGAVVVVCFAGDGPGLAGGTPAVAPEIASPWVGFGLAVVATMYAYDGWDGLALIAGEVRQPARTLPRATFLGLGLILAVYLAMNAGFFHALSIAEMATTPALAATAVGRVVGDNAARWVTAFVAFSAASTVFSSLMCNPRVVFALAEEGAFFPAAAYVHPRWKTPVVAIAIYGVMVMIYIASGTGFERLTRYMILGYLPFYGLVAMAAVRARRRSPPAAGQFAMPLYPLPIGLMLLYVTGGIASGFAGDPVAACGGIGILGAGALAYEVFRRRPARREVGPAPPRP